MKITIGIADDHQLFLKSLCILIESLNLFEVILEASNGKDMIQKLELTKVLPDILLVDVSMPFMDGIEATKFISEKYPTIKISALTTKDDDATIIQMIKAGCCAYMVKDMNPDDLSKALLEINSKGYYNDDASNINYRRLIKKATQEPEVEISKREQEFLQLATSDLTYKVIASKMKLAERTIDGYRESLFQKLNVQSRVGMVLEAIRKNLVTLN